MSKSMDRKRATRRNKAVFEAVVAHMGELLAPYGYRPHPAYEPAWEPSHMEYGADWLHEDVARRIDQVTLTFAPQHRLFRLSRQLTRNECGAKTPEDLPSAPFAFSGIWLNQGFTRFTLMDARNWWQFAKLDFAISKRHVEIPERAAQVLTARIARNLPQLLKAEETDKVEKMVVLDRFSPFSGSGSSEWNQRER